ncbi:hypothetical protein DENSPDRAFT_500817 [Dentipellis sp. KUC8613]|nr:hypothetical protein DENSPDRAFT_500817 [Dentipellis sp. KUC8613]
MNAPAPWCLTWSGEAMTSCACTSGISFRVNGTQKPKYPSYRSRNVPHVCMPHVAHSNMTRTQSSNISTCHRASQPKVRKYSPTTRTRFSDRQIEERHKYTDGNR